MFSKGTPWISMVRRVVMAISPLPNFLAASATTAHSSAVIFPLRVMTRPLKRSVVRLSHKKPRPLTRVISLCGILFSLIDNITSLFSVLQFHAAPGIKSAACPKDPEGFPTFLCCTAGPGHSFTDTSIQESLSPVNHLLHTILPLCPWERAVQTAAGTAGRRRCPYATGR